MITKQGTKPAFNSGFLPRQRGMGATIVLFTIALIVLVGAALAYASRDNPSALTTQGAKLYAGVLLKQSADYRDAYSRFIFDGKSAASMTFHAATPTANDLFYPPAQYGSYQSPPPQATTNDVAPVTVAWQYHPAVAVTDIGTSAAESIAFVGDLTLATCQQINTQLYGSSTVPVAGIAMGALLVPGSPTAIDYPATAALNGRASGCFATTDTKYVFFSTLGEA